jgi:hypothetical protein
MSTGSPAKLPLHNGFFTGVETASGWQTITAGYRVIRTIANSTTRRGARPLRSFFDLWRRRWGDEIPEGQPQTLGTSRKHRVLRQSGFGEATIRCVQAVRHNIRSSLHNTSPVIAGIMRRVASFPQNAEVNVEFLFLPGIP